jgi:hypothetical protein
MDSKNSKGGSIGEFLIHIMETSERGMPLIRVIITTDVIVYFLMSPFVTPEIRFGGLIGLGVIGSYFTGRIINNNKKD